MIPFLKKKKRVYVKLSKDGTYIAEYDKDFLGFVTKQELKVAKKLLSKKFKTEVSYIPIKPPDFLKEKLKEEIESYLKELAKKQGKTLYIYNHEINIILIDEKRSKIIVKGKIDYMLADND